MELRELFSMYEKEKLLLVSAIMFAGKKGLDEFLLEIHNKIINSGQYRKCLNEDEMKNVLCRVGMCNSMIEQAMIAINEVEE